MPLALLPSFGRDKIIQLLSKTVALDIMIKISRLIFYKKKGINNMSTQETKVTETAVMTEKLSCKPPSLGVRRSQRI